MSLLGQPVSCHPDSPLGCGMEHHRERHFFSHTQCRQHGCCCTTLNVASQSALKYQLSQKLADSMEGNKNCCECARLQPTTMQTSLISSPKSMLAVSVWWKAFFVSTWLKSSCHQITSGLILICRWGILKHSNYACLLGHIIMEKRKKKKEIC